MMSFWLNCSNENFSKLLSTVIIVITVFLAFVDWIFCSNVSLDLSWVGIIV